MNEEQIEAYKEEIKINPDDAEAHYNLSFVYYTRTYMKRRVKHSSANKLNKQKGYKILKRIPKILKIKLYHIPNRSLKIIS